MPHPVRPQSRSAFLPFLASFFLLAGCNPPAPPLVSTSIPPPEISVRVAFTDVTDKAGIRFRHSNRAKGAKWMPETMSGGAGFIDFDADGWLDIVFVDGGAWDGKTKPNVPSSIVFYRNRGDGTFQDVTRKMGVRPDFYGMGVAVADYDNDGFDDLYVSGIPSGHLFHNTANGGGGRRFEDVTLSARVEDKGWGTSCAWLDYDRDGNLDLFVAHYVQWSPKEEGGTFYSMDGTSKSYSRPQSFRGEACRLFRNLGGGKFADVSQKTHIAASNSKALGVAVCDTDNDGYLDIVVANDTEPNLLFHNQGDGSFSEVAQEAGIALSGEGAARAGMGIDTGDVTLTGNFDILISNFSGEQLSLYRRDNAGLFLDVASRAGVGSATQAYLGFGAFFFDYDLDGWLDIFIANGHIHDDIRKRDTNVSYEEPCLLFRNLGNGTFADMSRNTGVGLTARRVARAAAYGDFDNDGDWDVLVATNNSTPALLRNENQTENAWIRLVLQGKRSARCAIGAQIRVTVGSQIQTFEVKSGSSYLAASDRRLLVGLGTAKQANRVEVRWASGKVQSIGAVANGTTRRIVEED